MSKREQKFLMELKESFVAPFDWFYKIPDAPMAQRFMAPRPFDSILYHGNIPVAIEAKAAPKMQALNYNMLEEEQKIRLESFTKVEGRLGYILFNIRQPRDILNDLEHINICYCITYKELKLKQSIYAKDLNKYLCIHRVKNKWDVGKFLNLIESDIL